MNVEFIPKFNKDIKPLPLATKKAIKSLIQKTKAVGNITEIRNLKKMNGFNSYYRVRIGDYRIGIKLEDNTIIFMRAVHRNKIYHVFP